MLRLNPAYSDAVKARTNRCPFFSLLSMSIKEINIGSCLIEIDLDRKHLQPFGIVHGGAFASIIDAACFWAVFPEVDASAGMTTVDLKLNYLAPAVKGKLLAHGRCVKLGKTLGLGVAEVVDEAGKALAHGASTLMVMPDRPFSAKADMPPKFLNGD